MREAAAPDEADLEAFLGLLEPDAEGRVALGDLSNPCREVGLEALYAPVQELLAGINGRGRPVTRAEVRAYLLAPERGPEAELEELFGHLDYDEQGSFSVHRLRLCAEELLGEPLAAAEAASMAALLSGGASVSREQLAALPRLWQGP